MKIVLDTNVLVAAFVAEGLCRDIVRRRVRAHSLISSQVLLDELAGTLLRKFKIDPSQIAWLSVYNDHATLVDAQPLPVAVCRDPDDDFVLATALAGQADVIVTGDDDLLILGSYHGIRILSPRQFVMLVNS